MTREVRGPCEFKAYRYIWTHEFDITCTSFRFRLIYGLLVEYFLDLLDQTLLLMFLSAMGTSTVLASLGLSDRVVFGGTLSTGQGTVTAGTVGVGLVVGIIVGVGSLASSAGVGGELVVLGGELKVSKCK